MLVLGLEVRAVLLADGHRKDKFIPSKIAGFYKAEMILQRSYPMSCANVIAIIIPSLANRLKAEAAVQCLGRIAASHLQQEALCTALARGLGELCQQGRADTPAAPGWSNGEQQKFFFVKTRARQEKAGGGICRCKFARLAADQLIVAVSNHQRILDLPASPGFAEIGIERGIHHRHQPIDVVGRRNHAVPRDGEPIGSRASGARP
jgi:hypothetical protein